MDIERILSIERFQRYRNAAAGDIPLATELYQLNIEVSECIFGVLHIAEVSIRNSMHNALTTYSGSQDWFRPGSVLPGIARPIPYTMPMQKMIDKALRTVGRSASSGKIIAEITFGFWTSLLASRFQQSLWVPCLHRAFPNFGGPPRILHRRMETLQRLRNRIAHHERVLTSLNKLYTGHYAHPHIELDGILECVRWASIEAGDWIQTGTRFKRVQQLLLDFSRRGIAFT